MRMKKWEEENSSNLDEMTETLLKLNKKKQRLQEEEEDPNKEYVKPVYFMVRCVYVWV